MKRTLKGLGLLVLAMTLVVGGVVFRLWRDREEHLRLREADQARAPLSAPKSSRPTFVASPDASTELCLVGVVLDGEVPVADMQVTASHPLDVIAEQDVKTCGCTSCDCPAGRAALRADPSLGCLEGVRSTTTRVDGTFELCGLTTPLPRLLWAEHADGRLALRADSTPLRAGVPATLRVVPVIAVDGVVLDDEAPVAGATVVFYSVTAVKPYQAVTDAAGRFTMTLPGGVGRALVSAPDRAPRFVYAEVKHDGVLVLRLETPLRLDVHVTHEGRAVEGAEVAVEGDTAHKTDSAGDALIELSRTGSHVVRARKGSLVASAPIRPGRSPSRRLELSLAEGLALRGELVDEDGAPRAGAVRGATRAEEPLETDGTGHFELAPRPLGDVVYLTGEAPGCANGSTERFTIAPRGGAVRLSVRCAATVRGQVLDADGSPVPGALVSSKGAPVDLETRTDLTGRFALQLAPGTMRLFVEQKGYRLHQQPVTVPSSGDVIIVLDAGGSISGRVVDARGRGVAGVKVAAVPAVFEELVLVTEGKASAGKTDATGQFELPALEAGRWVVLANPNDAPLALSEPVALQPGERRRGLELKLTGDVDLTGVVVDARGAPVPGATLEFDPSEDKALLLQTFANLATGRYQAAAVAMPRQVVSGVDGRFTFKAMPLSPMPLTVTAEGFEETRQRVSRGEQVRIELRRPTRWTITGRATDDRGKPLPTFEVNGSVFTPADGRFDLDTDSESVVVYVRAPGFLAAERKVKRAVPTADLGTVKLQRARALSVRVRSQAGAPLADASVVARQGDTREDCDTTDLGECVVTPLEDAETGVKVRRKGFAPREVTLTAAELALPLQVTLEPAGARLEGQVLAGPGRPIAGRAVSANGPVFETTTSNAEGRFSITGLVPGAYCASAKLTPGLFSVEWAVPAVASASPQPVTVGPLANGATIEVHAPLGVARVVLANGSAGPQTVKGFDSADADELCAQWERTTITAMMTNTMRFEGLPPGEWSVFVLSMMQLEERAGKVTPTVFELGPGQTRVVE